MAAKRCEICGMAVYCSQEDIVFGIKHTKGWTMKLICAKCLGDRTGLMKEYKKAVSKLVRMARATRNHWREEGKNIPMGNGMFRNKRRDPEHEVELKNYTPVWEIERERAVAEDRRRQEVADCGGGC